MAEQELARLVGQPTLVLGDFEGPLDLLLHLIKKAEVDIYDIPIAKITNQYVEFLHQQEQNQFNIAGEYFVMAATLMSIKSAMLLPSPRWSKMSYHLKKRIPGRNWWRNF